MTLIPDLLIGKELRNGWKITGNHPSYCGATGGEHALSLVASREDGSEAYVKLLDTSVNRDKDDPLSDLQLRIEVFQYERSPSGEVPGTSYEWGGSSYRFW